MGAGVALALWAMAGPRPGDAVGPEALPPAAPAPSPAARRATPVGRSAGDHAHDHEGEPDAHAPNHALRSDRPRPTRTADVLPGAPPVDHPVAAAGDPRVWTERQAQTAAAWREQTHAAVHRFAAARGLPNHERDAAIGALDTLHDGLSDVRADLQAGARTAADGRQAMADLREDALRALVEALGPDLAGSLRRALADEVHGGGF